MNNNTNFHVKKKNQIFASHKKNSGSAGKRKPLLKLKDRSLFTMDKKQNA
jgi:hypothetical protein